MSRGIYQKYENNRENSLLNISKSNTLKITDKNIALFERLVGDIIESSIHPLEKDSLYGLSAMGHLIVNSGAGINVLEIVARLHKDCLCDLSENGITAMELAFNSKRPKEVIKWLAHNMPDKSLHGNIEAMFNMDFKNQEFSIALDILRARQGRLDLNLSVEKIADTQKANIKTEFKI